MESFKNDANNTRYHDDIGAEAARIGVTIEEYYAYLKVKNHMTLYLLRELPGDIASNLRAKAGDMIWREILKSREKMTVYQWNRYIDRLIRPEIKNKKEK
jgi:hypothetical protein